MSVVFDDRSKLVGISEIELIFCAKLFCMKIAGSYLQLLFDFAAYQYIPESQLKTLLTEPGIDLCAADCLVPITDYQKVVHALVSRQKQQGLGLVYGVFLNLKALGLIHQISLETTSIQQAFRLLEDYLRIHFPLVSLEKEEVGPSLQVHLRSKLSDPIFKEFVLDSTFCFIYRELSTMMKPELIQLGLPYEDRSPFQRQLRHNIEHSESHRFSFTITSVNDKINQRQLQVVDVLLPKYLLLLEKKEEQSFPTLVKKMMLNMSTPALPNLSQVSAQFAMSDRSFQRKLRANGQSFRTIANELKRNLALYLQAGGKMKVKDIAYILGYSEPSAFLHAARKWSSGSM